MLTTASFSMQAPGQAADDFVVDQNYGPILTCTFKKLPEYGAPKREDLAQTQLATLITEVKASEENQNPKYSWMRGEDRNQFDTLMSRNGQIGGRGWDDIADKLATTQNWLANQEIEARYAILHKDITEVHQTTMYGLVSLRPAKYDVLSQGDISEFSSLFTSGSTTLKTIEKLSIAQQWWDHVQDQYVVLKRLLGSLDYDLKALSDGTERNPEFRWMTQEDHAAFADARVTSTAMNDSISDMHLSYKKVSEKKAAYTSWLANRHQFRTDTIALEQFVVGMAPAEQAAFNAAKVSMTYTAENNISDSYHSLKSPAEKLAIYTAWLDAYRQNQAAIIALDSFSTGVDMTTAEQEAFNAAKASTTWVENSISDSYHGTKSPAEKLAIYTAWLDAYRAANA